MNCHRFYVLVKIVWRYENKTVQYTVFSSAVKNETETAAEKRSFQGDTSVVVLIVLCLGIYSYL